MRIRFSAFKSSVMSSVFLVLTSLTLILLGQVPTKDTASPEPQDSDVSRKETLFEIKASFPIVQFDSPLSQDDRIRKISKKYGSLRVLFPELQDNITEAVYRDWEIGLSALPVEQSDLIIVGKVQSANAYLSENRAAVFSAFDVEIESTLKHLPELNLSKTSNLIVEREGGIVRFPGGFETWSMVVGQKMPKAGRKYLFFLSRTFPGIGFNKDGLHIVTAYDITDAEVVPLDHPSGGKHPIAKEFRGQRVETLLSHLSAALKVN